MSSDGVFLTWNDSRRSTSICARLGLERVVIVPERHGFSRHVLGALATIVFLVRKRPQLVWFQFSLVLGVILSVYASMRRAGRVQLVADLHTKAMRRSGPAGVRRIVRLLKRIALQRCLAVLVTNSDNARYTERVLGARPLVLPDPLPQPPRTLRRSTSSDSHSDIVFICSFAADEPIWLMVEAANQFRGEARIVFTGNASGVRPSVRREIERVGRFTGFLPDADYWQLLRSARCIVVLSDEPACLPCGAYESIAVGRRPIVADDAHAREVFGDLAVYTQLAPVGLTGAIRETLISRFQPEESRFVATYEQQWSNHWQIVQKRLGNDARAGATPKALVPDDAALQGVRK